MTAKKLIPHWLVPKTFVARMSSVLVIGILFAQGLGSWIWLEQSKLSERDEMTRVSKDLGSRIGKTLGFFDKLPNDYSYPVRDQLRDGYLYEWDGARFFISVNTRFVNLSPIAESEFSQLVRKNLESSMFAQVGRIDNLEIKFVDYDNVKILTGTNYQNESSSQIWKKFHLLDPGDESPVAVIQFPLDEDDWVYLAAVVPKGDLLLNTGLLNGERLLNHLAVTLTAIFLTLLIVRRLVSPLKLLSHQADLLGKGRNPRKLEEKGSKEMVTTIRAFNLMAERIQRFVSDREHTFAAISHDLRTPLTRARLRVEEIEDDSLKESLIEDLVYLESMVKGSLQVMKEGVEHENTEIIDLREMLVTILNKEKILGLPIKHNLRRAITMKGRPIAIQRLFSNLINNALSYGKGVEVKEKKHHNGIVIQIIDSGSGLSDAEKENVFQPYYRLEHKLSKNHSGLGMGIARNIANIHGGELELKDRPGGGLIVEIYFPL